MESSIIGVALNSIAFITYIYFGAYLLFLNHKSEVNLLFFTVCLIYALWNFSFIFINSPIMTHDEKIIWLKIGYTAAYSYSPFLLLFALHFTKYNKKIKRKRLFIVLIFILSAVYLYMHLIGNAIINDIPFGFWYYSSHIYANLYNLVSMIIVIIGAVRSDSNRIKLQMKIICAGAVTAIILGLFSDFYRGYRGLPTLTPILLIIWIGSVWFALVKHRFLAINEKLINEITLKNIEEVILILDPHYKIITANNKFLTLTNLSLENIKKRSVFDVISDSSLKNSLNTLLRMGKTEIYLKLVLDAAQNRECLLDIRLQQITDKYNDLLGVLLIGKEVKGLERIRKTYGISARETDVIRYVMTGNTNKQIALQLSITERTVKSHLTNIYNKMGIDNKVLLLNAVIEG